MNKKILSILLCIAILVTISPYPRAQADGMTAAMIAELAFGMASSWGINFTAGNATAQGMSDFMTGQVESYVIDHGGSIGSLFVGQAAVDVAGKLVVGQQLYEGVRNFVDWLNDKYSLSMDDFSLTSGEYEGTFLPENKEGGQSITGVGIECSFNESHFSGYKNVEVFNNGLKVTGGTTASTVFFTGNYTIGYDNPAVYVLIERKLNTGASASPLRYNVATVSNLSNSLSWNVPSGWSEPQPLPQDKQWEGDFTGTPGWAEPQDLPDFLSRIPVGIADNNLVVVGQVTQATGPSPSPSPSPSPGQSPSYNAGKISIILAEILNLIKNLTGDTATDPDPDVIDQISQEIAGQSQTLPDSISQSSSQVKDAIDQSTQTITETAEQTKEAIEEATQTITETATQTKEAIEEATDVPEQSKWDEVKKDLHGVFPFCIPWDIYAMLNVFNAESKTPKFEIPFNYPAIGLEYTFDFDFQDFDQVAETLRTVELIAFCVGLAILTSKVIRW